MSETITIASYLDFPCLIVSASYMGVNYEYTSEIENDNLNVYAEIQDDTMSQLVTAHYSASLWTPVLADRLDKWVLSESQP